jgi:hypothetical protein
VISILPNGKATFKNICDPNPVEITTFSWLWVNNTWSINDKGLAFLRRHVPRLEGKWYTGKPVRVVGEPGVQFKVKEFLGDRALVEAFIGVAINPVMMVHLDCLEEMESV